MQNKRLERTRHERASLLSGVGEPLKCSVGLPRQHMAIAKKFLLLGGVIVGVLAIANCAMVTVTLIRSCKQLDAGRPCDLFELAMFMLAFLVPGLFVSVGAFAYFAWEKFWGLGLLWVGGFVNELLVMLFFVGLVIAFQDVQTILLGVILEFLSIIPVLGLSFVLIWLQRRNPTRAWSGLAMSGLLC